MTIETHCARPRPRAIPLPPSRAPGLRRAGRSALWLCAALLWTSGCGLISFDIDQAIPEQRVTSNIVSGVLGTLVPTPFPLTINLAQETKARGTGPVSSAGLKSLSFKITPTAMPQGDTDNFDFVQSVDIFIESSQSGSKLTRQKIADLPSPPKGASQLDLHCYGSVDLVPYINEGSRITSTATGTTPPDDVTFNGAITVEARL